MSSPTTRGGRRRRVLNEEFLSASSIMIANPFDEPTKNGTPIPRYGEQAHIENHPQITDFIPRRPRALIVGSLIGISTAVGAYLTTGIAGRLAAGTSDASTSLLAAKFADGLVSWLSAVYLLLAAAVARILFHLRRHRVDDYRGRYRVWRYACWAALIASCNAVVGGGPLASMLGERLTGWSWTASGAEWWLFPVVLFGGWLGVRATIEAQESRGALAAALAAWTCYLAAGCVAIGLIPVAWGGVEAATRTLPLVGHTFALAALALFARYVVLDVQGLINHPQRDGAPTHATQSVRSETSLAAASPAAQESASSAAIALAAETVAASAASPYAERRLGRTASDDTTLWIDGSEPEDGDERPLSKAEIKRLRKQKQRRGAA